MSIVNASRRRFLGSTGSFAIGSVLGGASYLSSLPAIAATRNWTLEVKRDGREFRYNEKSTGPVITANAGETIEVKLINSMDPKTDDICVENMNTFHGENVTNLHTHGLHVSPDKDSTGIFDADNVFLKVVPRDQSFDCWKDATYRNGESEYRFELPADHPPGTHWYHAHKHGSTAMQVAGGLAGPLIVKDPPGVMPDYIANAPERIFMITEKGVVEVDPNGGGQSDHSVPLAPGAVERWRVINADPRSNSFVKLNVDPDKIELYQIAFDGLTLEQRVPITLDDDRDPWETPGALAPGNRSDFLLRVKNEAPEGPVVLAAEQLPDRFLHMEDGHGLALAARPKEIRIEITGSPVSAEWSQSNDLPGSGLDPIEGPIAQTRNVKFDMDFTVNPPRFTINGKLFGEEEPLFQMKLDTIEEWTLENPSSGMHPFHIHVNPFFVTHINGEELDVRDPRRRWQDTIAIPGASNDGTPGTITFKTRYLDFTGKFVVHCHILGHEDRGMMRVVEVIDS